MITEPYQLGIHLSVPTDELDKFEKNHHKDVDRQMIEVIKYWHNNADDCSWEALANAVEKMDKYGNLVKRLREWHSKPVGQNAAEVVVNKPVKKTAAVAR